MVTRRILQWDVNRTVYYLGCYYFSNRRYTDTGPVVLAVKPGAGRAYLPVRGASRHRSLPW